MMDFNDWKTIAVLCRPKNENNKDLSKGAVLDAWGIRYIEKRATWKKEYDEWWLNDESDVCHYRIPFNGVHDPFEECIIWWKDVLLPTFRLKDLIQKMLKFKIGNFPSWLEPQYDEAVVSKKERDQDSKAPFFTEAYLYELIGKDDARTVLYYIHEICKEIGLDLF